MNQQHSDARRFGIFSVALLTLFLASAAYAGGPCENDDDCDDGLRCTYDRCDLEAGCVHLPWPCGDANPCTDDTCVEATGCVYVTNSAACNDGNDCTSADTCSNGVCTGTPNSNPCNDGNACSIDDVCQSGTCTGVPRNCDDSNPCTNDSCNSSSGCQNVPRTCEDNIQCTNNVCTPSTGQCSFPPLPAGTSCYNGPGCRAADTCNGAGQCVSGAPDSCDDNNPCTFDRCLGSGCRHDSLGDGTVCNDGNPCTISDQCGSGVCRGFINPGQCMDGGPCSRGHCNPATGSCEYDPIAECDWCIGGGGTCDAAGICQPTNPSNDPDGDGKPTGCDCLPGDPSAWAVPPEVRDLRVTAGETSDLIVWTDAAQFAGYGTTHDVVRGYLSELPVGGVPLEACLVSGTDAAFFHDGELPSASAGFWYLVRAKNACGVGTYGSGELGTRQTSACP